MRDRTSLVLELIKTPKSISAVLEELNAHGWYCEKHLAIVRKQDVLAVLKKFQNGELSANEVTDWANSVGGRTDIGLEFGADGVVEETLYWLAHPEITGAVDHELCERIIAVYERRKVRRQ